MSNFHRGHSIDASYQVSVHLAKRFQRRRFLKISQSETRICNMFILYITSRYSHFNILFSKPCQRQYELLPSLGVRHLSSVTEEKTFLEINQSETRIACGGHVC
jgi:hypothetical protein